MMGKINMEGHWCIWCNLCKKDWKEKRHELGALWTVDTLSQHQMEGCKTKNERKGVVKPLLSNVVEAADYYEPCLHLLLGIYNEPLDHLFLIVILYIEPLTPHLLTKYNQFETARLAWDIDNECTQEYKSIFKRAIKKQSKSCLPLFRKIWNILKEYSIDPAQYHGGKLIGPHSHLLMENAEEILKRIYSLLIEQPNRRGRAADDQKLRNLFDSYARIFILQDIF